MELTQVTMTLPALVVLIALPILLVTPPPSEGGEPSPVLTRERASAFARLALKAIEQGVSRTSPNTSWPGRPT